VRRLGLDGIEGGRLIEEPGEKVALGRAGGHGVTSDADLGAVASWNVERLR
jgi:hypothetical protein